MDREVVRLSTAYNHALPSAVGDKIGFRPACSLP